MRIDEFLLARVAEDEAVARDAIREIGRIEWVSEFAKPSITSAGPLWCDPDGMGVHVATEPARVLAECEAKRRVVAEHDAAHILHDQGPPKPCSVDVGTTRTALVWPCRTMRILAAVYADHPDFDPAWRL